MGSAEFMMTWTYTASGFGECAAQAFVLSLPGVSPRPQLVSMNSLWLLRAAWL